MSIEEGDHSTEEDKNFREPYSESGTLEGGAEKFVEDSKAYREKLMEEKYEAKYQVLPLKVFEAVHNFATVQEYVKGEGYVNTDRRIAMDAKSLLELLAEDNKETSQIISELQNEQIRVFNDYYNELKRTGKEPENPRPNYRLSFEDLDKEVIARIIDGTDPRLGLSNEQKASLREFLCASPESEEWQNNGFKAIESLWPDMDRRYMEADTRGSDRLLKTTRWEQVFANLHGFNRENWEELHTDKEARLDNIRNSIEEVNEVLMHAEWQDVPPKEEQGEDSK